MQQEQKLAEEKMQKQREEWEQQVREMNDKMREKEEEIKSQMQSEGDLDKRRLAEQLAQQESKLAEELVKAEIVFEKKQEELMQKQRELESSLQKQMREAKQLSQQKDRERIERIRFDDQLLHSIPLINEANSIGEELQRQTVFALKLITCWPTAAALSKTSLSLEDDEAAIAESIAADLKVQVNFQEAGTFRSVLWDADLFLSNIFVMREMYQVFIENNRALSSMLEWKEAQDFECDPFYEPPQPQLIGKSFVFLKSIEFGCKITDSVPIFDQRGAANGTLKCEITPTVLSHEWQALQHRLVETCPEDVAQLQLPTLADFVGSNLRVNVCVDRLRGIPGKLCKDVYVVIKWSGGGEEEEHTSPPAPSPTVDPQIDFSVVIERMITPELIAYVSSSPLEISVHGIVPSSNLNSVSSQAVDLRATTKQPSSARDEGEDSGDSVAFFDVDARGKNKLASKRSVRRRNGKLLSEGEDATTLLDQCREQLAVQGKILAENTQELEHKTHEVVVLQRALHTEQLERDRLRDEMENLVRTNKLLQAKLEQQILKQSVARFAPDRKKSAAVSALASRLGNLTRAEERSESAGSTVSKTLSPPPAEDIDTLVKQAVFDDAFSPHNQPNRLSPLQETLHSEDLPSDRSQRGQVHAVYEKTATLQPENSGEQRAMPQAGPQESTDIVATTPPRVKQKGLFHAVFSVQHRGKKGGCPVS